MNVYSTFLQRESTICERVVNGFKIGRQGCDAGVFNVGQSEHSTVAGHYQVGVCWCRKRHSRLQVPDQVLFGMYAQFLRLLTPVGLYLPEFLHSAFFPGVALGFVGQVCWQGDGDGLCLV